MARRRGKKRQQKQDVARENYEAGLSTLGQHPMFGPLLSHAWLRRWKPSRCPEDGWAVVTSEGSVHVHPTRVAHPDEWVYVLAHCLLHLGFGHFRARERPREWNAACDCFVARFLADLKLGKSPHGSEQRIKLPVRTEERLYEHFCEQGIYEELRGFGTAGPHSNDMVIVPERAHWLGGTVDWQACLASGLAMAASSAVSVAAGRQVSLGANDQSFTPARRAREWFISSFPLMGAMAASFEIIEDPLICRRMDISVAAVDAETSEVFVNPGAGLDQHECRFVMAHELLHVGLRHQARRQGRDAYLWNVACDYVINGWLVEMGLGELPKIGVLYDPDLKGCSAETVYDRMATDMRRYRKLATLRGVGLGDILERGLPEWWAAGDGIGLDEAVFCQGKTPAQVADIIGTMRQSLGPVLLTRLDEETLAALPADQRRDIDYDPLSRTGLIGAPQVSATARVAVVTAGTTDLPAAREAVRTLAYYGEAANEIADVGAAGLWRLMARIEELRRFGVIIVAAGMDGALFSVVGGLVAGAVIALPTSTGYGAARGGETALFAALASCAPGISVVNIDNGYGAACAALRILNAS